MKKAHTRTSSVFRSYKLSCYKELWGFALLFHCKTRRTPWLYSVLSSLYWPYNWAKRQRNSDSQMASLKACPSKLSFTCTQRVSLEPPLKGNIKNCDNVIETAFVHEPAYLDPLLFCFFVLCFICYRWDEMAHFIFRTKWSWHTWTRHTVYLSLEKSSFLCWKQIQLSAFTLKKSTQTKDWMFFATQN